ncbi:catalase domain-containing protein [Phthorimaea operculella]|nr:catalase domain-containing protein [Phthorimaea operculella]
MARTSCVLLGLIILKHVSCQSDNAGFYEPDKVTPKGIEETGPDSQASLEQTKTSVFDTERKAGAMTSEFGNQKDSIGAAGKPDSKTTSSFGGTTKNAKIPELTDKSQIDPLPTITSAAEPGVDSPFTGPKAFPKNQPIFDNTSLPTERQLLDFRQDHPKPIGFITISSGLQVDVRDTITFNSDLGRSDYFYDIQSNAPGQRVPERIVHAKGTAAWGFFEVTNDVSKYTYADVFNGIGKKTKVLGRLSVGAPERGVSDLMRDLKGFAMKFYTKDGILDFLNLQTPVFAFKDPVDFNPFGRVIARNPMTNLPDPTALLDLLSLRPHSFPLVLYLTSDRGIPDGWRHADFFPIHTYELVNEHGERSYARFSWRTERGLRNLTLLQIFAIQGITSDYYIRDLYNAIANKKIPSWRLEMDVLSLQDVQKVDYNPFDVTRLWKNGTYKTVNVGRLTLNRISDNHFRDQEQAAFDPSHLVPGIPGPVDALFRGRRFAYRDAQNYRIGTHNFYKNEINHPFYEKSYKRDGNPSVRDNGKDSPTYYPNLFNGPLPLVDERRPEEYLQVLESNAVDLEEANRFYEEFAPDEASKDRMALNNASLIGLKIYMASEDDNDESLRPEPELEGSNVEIQIKTVKSYIRYAGVN